MQRATAYPPKSGDAATPHTVRRERRGAVHSYGRNSGARLIRALSAVCRVPALVAAALLAVALLSVSPSAAQTVDIVPSAPQNFTATPADGQVTLRWDAPADSGSSGIEGYEYRYAAGASVPSETAWISYGLNRTTTIGGLTNGTAYAFEVRAVSDAGESDVATTAATPATRATRPTVPQNLSTTPGDGEVTLTWQAPMSDGGSALTGYEYRHAEGASVPTTTIWKYAGTSLTATIAGLTNGTGYAFEVRTVNRVGVSDAVGTTAMPTAPVTVPDAPQNLTAAPGDGRVTLTWQAPANDGGSAVTGYEYRHAEGPSVPTETAWASAGTSLTATIASLTNGTGYAFEARAVNDAGESDPASATAMPAAPATVPSAPQNLTATPANGQVTLNWQAPANDGGARILHYIYRFSEGVSIPIGVSWEFLDDDLTVTIASLTNDTAYAFEVRAVNRMGVSDAATTAATPATRATRPTAPRNLTAAPRDGAVTLTWQAPMSDGGSVVTGYEYRHAEGASVPTTTIWKYAGTSLTATIASLTNGTGYAFEVRTVNRVGVSDAVGTTAMPTAPVTVPDAPQNLTAAPGDGRVTLTWQAPANDGGSAVTGYEYRHAEGPSVPTETAWASAGTSLTATIGGLTNGTGYAFEARAVNDAGESDPASATAMPAAPATVPSAPQNLTATPANGQVTLNWQAPANDGGARILHYIYRFSEGVSIPIGVSWDFLDDDLTVTIASLTNDTAYAFEVRAVNRMGVSDAATTAATPATRATRPTAPRNLTAAPRDGAVTLTWQAPMSDGGSVVTGYEYRHAEGASVPTTTIWKYAGTSLTATIASLTNGTGYAFEVRTVNRVGVSDAVGTTAMPTAPVTVPDAPQNLTAAPGDGRVTLTWQAPMSDGGSAVTGYDYRHAEGASVPAETAWQSAGTSLTATIAGLTNGTGHAFEVRAVNDAGEGEPSTAAATPAAPATVPGQPQNLAAAPGDGEVTLTWQAPANDGGSAVTGYDYRHAEGASVPTETAWQSAGASLTATIAGLTNGTGYAFEVRAVNDAGESDPASATAMPAAPATVPSAPQNLTATPANGQVTLNWQAPASDGGEAILNYVYRFSAGVSVPSGVSWEILDDDLTVTIAGLTNDTGYAFEVRAVNRVGASDAVGTTAMPTAPVTVPDAPQNLTAAPGDGRVTLTWQTPANDGGSAVTGYEYRHAEGPSVPTETAWASAGTSLTATIGGLTNGTGYAFEARAVNDAGESDPASATAMPAAPATVPSAPQNLTATPANGQVTLNWQAPANDGGAGILNYIYRFSEGVSVPSGVSWEFLDDDLTVTIAGLTNGTGYAFEVRTVNRVGVSDAVGTTAMPTAPVTVPDAPQNLTAAPGDGRVTLTWQAPANDGGSAVTGYEYRHAEGPSVPTETAWASAGTSLTATIASLTNGTGYAFEARAVNDAGESDPASATAMPAAPATVPSAPQNLTATPANGQVTLNWQAPASDGGEAILNYVYRFSAGVSVPIGVSWEFLDDDLTVTIASLTNDTAYAFEVRAVNRMGISDAATTAATPATRATRPTAPQNLTAAPGDGRVTLTWQAPMSDGGSAVTGYEYRHAEGASVPTTTIWKYAGTSLTVTVGSLTNGTAYAFEVRTANRVGVSDAVGTTAMPTAPVTVPDAPQNLTAAPGDGEVTLTWQAPASDGGSAVTGYDYRHAEGASVPAETAWQSAGASLTATIAGLTNGTGHAFEVRAVNDAGEGEPSTAAATPAVPATVPDAPQNLTAAPGDGRATLTWQAPANDGGSAVTGYDYRHAEGPSVPTETAWASAGTSLTATIGSLTNGTGYAFEVRTVNRVGVSDAVGTTATPTAPVTVPDAPQNLTAAPGDGEVTLTWQAPMSDGGSAVTGYDYRHAEGASVPTETDWQSAGASLTATIAGLTNGTGHAFEVRAVNDAGEGEPSTAAATPAAPATVPGQPQNLAAAPGDGEVTLTWQAPANDGGSAVTGYDYRHAEGASVPAETVWQSAGASLTATIAGLTNGTGHAFEVRAVNDAGEGEPSTAAATPAAPATVPGQPQNLAAAPGDGRVTLTWQAPASDGGSAVTGYDYRHAEGPSIPAETAWQSAGTSLTATIAGLTNGTGHAFEVRAVNDAGEGEPSTAAATPAAPATIPDAPQNLAAAPGDGRVTLTWQAPASDGGAPIVRYDISYGEPGSGSTTEITGDDSLTAMIVGLTNGTEYNFLVWAVNSAGGGTWAALRATPATVPGLPQNLTARHGNGFVVLDWESPASDGGSAVNGHQYRYAAGTSVPSETAWIDGGGKPIQVFNLDNGTAYAFEVRLANEIGAGAAAAVTATPARVPGPPQILAAAPGDGEVTLTWQAPASDGGSAVTGYEYRYAAGTAVPTETAWQSAGTKLTTTIASLTNGTGYAFEVRAVNDAGEGASSTAAAMPAVPATVPDAPQNLTAAPGDGRATLTWQAPANDGGSAVTGYDYRHAEGPSVPTETAWASAGTSLTATIGSLTNGTGYAFEVRTVNRVGVSDAVGTTATPTAPVTVPDAPQNLTAAPGDGEVTLTWQAPMSDGGSAVTGYDYRHAEGASVPTETDWQSAGASLTATIAGLTNGTGHAFEVRAVNDAGEGEPSTAAATPAAPATVPGQPQNLAAAPGDGRVTLTWQAPANDGGSAVTGYDYRHAEGASVPTETDWQSAGASLTATIAGLTNGTGHAFEVRAVNDAGEGEPSTAAATPAAPATVPGQPQNLAAAPGDGRVTLTWQAPANDGGSAVTGYDYRHAEGVSVPAGTAWQSAGTSLTATIAGLTNGTGYAFEVRAVNDAGEGEPSTAAATPAAPAKVPDAPQNLATTPGDGRVTLAWETPASDGGTKIDRYEYRYSNGGSAVSAAAGSRALQANGRQAGTPQWVSVGLDRAVTVNSLENGAQYVFDVRAVNDVGPGPAARVTVSPTVAPDAPRDLRATPGDRKVTLEWKPPANDGGSPVRLYIYRHAEGTSVPTGTQWESVQDALTVTIENLTNGTQYAFELRAVNSAGASDAAGATATPIALPTVDELQGHIAGFLLNRANALANNQPRLTRFLKDRQTGNGLAGQVTEQGGEVRGSLYLQDIWLNAGTAWSDSDGARSRYLFGAAGGHWRLDEGLLAGLMLQVDLNEEALPGDKGSIDGKGGLAGLYFAAQLDGQPLYFEGRVLHGRTDNRLVHGTGVTGEFGTERWLAQFRAEGDVELDYGLRLTPFADLLSIRNRQLRFTDSLGRRVGSQTVGLEQAKAGIDFRLPLPADKGDLALTGGVAGAYSATDGGRADAGFAGGRARVDLGFDYRLDDAVSIELKGHYDGIGKSNYRSYGLNSSLKIRF